MQNQTQRFADEAIFQLQLPTTAAVRYVTHNAGVRPEQARQALQDAMIGYKSKKAR
jgi:hypothetical protein